MITKANRLQNVKEYYFSTKLREVAGLVNQGKPIINIAIGNPDLSPSEEVLDAIKSSLSHEKAHGYQSYQGLPLLRGAVSKFYQKNYNVALDSSSEVLPLMGSKEGIMHISMAFLNKGDKVLIPNPGYPTYTSVTNLLGAEPIFYDLKGVTNWQPDFEALEKEDLEGVKIMWLNYPHMPTGAPATTELYKKFVDFAVKHNILLVNDNPYSFILNDNPLSILGVDGAKEVALELNSLSKTFNMAGWRVGMLLGNPELIKTVLQVKSNMDSGMFFGIQQGAIVALNSSDDWYDKINSIYSERRKIVWAILDKLNCSYDKNSGGMFVWAKLPEGISTNECVDDLLYNKNIFITPGNIFGSNGEGYIRLSLCVNENQLTQALERL
ncbi:pyridoxal phosphate-dependent aminotransferase [Urechidicola vernalis]|uniref:Aminotransferase n=1 Tax=Urechidicola vernalis TaxID=3075600 RepID=A0ABU2Y718_9FLAO|nr:aminotransferase class I/II-fold pyridoxal phosphate-dependent enzyme [Urechidicola sp. P050]MDT0553487.1 aminotransferase class I/II-fold pyridoxal phosphate-dependent enzyme [Urechidicola sp. P050]